MALRCLKSSTFRPLGPIRIIQDRSNMAKSFSGTAAIYPVIPTVELQHESEIPSADVLSRLNIFDSWREELRMRETDYRLSRDQMRDAQEIWRQHAFGLSPKKNEGGTITQFLVRERGWGDGPGQEYSEQEEHSTVIGSEVEAQRMLGEDMMAMASGDGVIMAVERCWWERWRE